MNFAIFALGYFAGSVFTAALLWVGSMSRRRKGVL